MAEGKRKIPFPPLSNHILCIERESKRQTQTEKEKELIRFMTISVPAAKKKRNRKRGTFFPLSLFSRTYAYDTPASWHSIIIFQRRSDDGDKATEGAIYYQYIFRTLKAVLYLFINDVHLQTHSWLYIVSTFSSFDLDNSENVNLQLCHCSVYFCS